MKNTFALLATASLYLLMLVGNSYAEGNSPPPQNTTCEAQADQKLFQVKNPHYASDEPWKKRWAIGAADFMQSKFTEAEPELVAALKLAKDANYVDVQPGILQMLGLVYMQEGQYEQAISTLQQAIDMEKASLKPSKGTIYAALIGQGDAYRREKMYDKALVSLQEAKAMMLPCSPGYQQMMENTAQVYEGMGKLPHAESIFSELVSYADRIRNDELLLNYLTNLGEIQLQLKEYAKLANTLDRAYPYVVNKYGADSQQAILFAKNIQHVKDARDAQQGPITYGGPAKEWLQLMTSGNKNLNTKQYTSAANDFEKALKLAEAEGTQTPPTSITRAKLALAYSFIGNFKGAETQFRQALPILRQHPEVISPESLGAYERLYQMAKTKNKIAKK